MEYNPAQIKQLERDYALAVAKLTSLRTELTRAGFSLSNAKAREFLHHGACRRLKTIRKCLENVYAICPVSRINKLNDDELSNIQINLHAFMVNVHGLLDNAAWVYVFENSLENSIGRGRFGVDLFKSETQKHLPSKVSSYLTTDKIRSWHSDYAKNYRDALAHRIPLYVPPARMTDAEMVRDNEIDDESMRAIMAKDFDLADKLEAERATIGKICPAFIHSFSESKAPLAVLFHAQMIADSNTCIEILEQLQSCAWKGPSN
jgi:hypothetical protein